MFDGQTLTTDGSPIVAQTNGHGAPATNTPPTIPEQAPVVVRFKKHDNPIEVEIDPDALTWDDFLTISSAAGKNLSEEETMAKVNVVLSKLTNQDVGKLPARVVTAIINQLQGIAGPEKNSA